MIKVGDYVRIDNGCICKVLEYTDISDNDFYVNTDSPYNVVYKSWIVKSSPNIIDLIEEDDFINGSRITELKSNKNGVIKCMLDSDYELITTIINEEIESVVTKEQFESMEYKIGE